MLGITTVKIHSYQKGLYYRDGEFVGLLGAGRHWFVSLPGKVRVDVVSQRDVWLFREDLDIIVKSECLKDEAVVLDLKDYERALVWIDGRFNAILAGGRYAFWTKFRKVRVETVDAREVRLDHADLNVILRSAGSGEHLEAVTIDEGHVGVYFRNGKYVQTLAAGKYAFWKGVDKVKVLQVNMRDLTLDVAGQEIMTADKVTLRLNAVVTYRVADARVSVEKTDDVKQALYREAQLALRAVIGTRELDALLSQKDAVAAELEQIVRVRAADFGLTVAGLGIRDIILPGEMKDLMNKVTEAKKAAEANLIARREETAAMRNQLNTAKLLESNPTLMRLRELEVLEKVASNSKMSVVLGEKGLADRVVNLL
jgi:regulator of protease activity HflC (stomatin/prohibitin superfamily)